MTSTVAISIDVPDLEQGVLFYTRAFGFTRKADPIRGVVVVQGLNVELCLLEKAPGSRPSIGTNDLRRYERHWTPVHIDIHVDDLKSALARAIEAGAVKEQVFEHPEHGSAAFCSDPFGHGFCLIERRKKGGTAA